MRTLPSEPLDDEETKVLIYACAAGAVASQFIRDLGVDLKQLEDHFDVNFYPDMGLSKGVFFDKKHFGQSKLRENQRSRHARSA